MSETKAMTSHSNNDTDSPAEQNWRIVKTALLGRIARRHNALVRLAPDTFDPGTLQADVARAGDNATALLDLLNSTERAVDRVFASRSRRIAASPQPPASTRPPDVDAFKAN